MAEEDNQTVDIFMNDGEAHPNSRKESSEVYVNPSSGASIVIMEDDPPDIRREERPIPPRAFAPPVPTGAGANNSGQSHDRRGRLETKEMLPEDALLQFADLDALANPEKVAPKPIAGASAGQGKASAEPTIDDTPDRPVPPKFPPAPKTRGGGVRRREAAPTRKPAPGPPPPPTAMPKRSSSTVTERERRRESSAGERRPAPVVASENVWDSGFQVESGRKEVYRVNTNNIDNYDDEDENNRARRRRSGRNERRDRRDRFEDDEDDTRKYYDDPYSNVTDRNDRDGGNREEYFYDSRQNRYLSSPQRGRRSRDRHGGGDRRRRKPDDVEDGEEVVISMPRAPAVSAEEMRRRREEEEKKEKMQLLHKLYQYEQRGHRMANSYSMDSNIDELRFEVAKIRNEENAKRSVKWYKVIMMVLVSTVETLNTKFDPFGLRLKGWSKDMNEKKEDLDDSFHRLHDKYSSKSTIEPEWELAFAFFGGAFMYHLQNAAENYGELGGMLSSIATGGGSGGSTAGSSGRSVSAQRSSGGAGQGRINTPNVPGWTYSQYPSSSQTHAAQTQQQQQPTIMTNMPLFQHQAQTQQQPSQSQTQQQQQQQVGKTGRRIMRGPALPAAGGMVGMEMMSMVNNYEEPSDDVPIDFSLPITVGGSKAGTTAHPTTPKMPTIQEQATKTRSTTPSGASGASGARSSDTSLRSRGQTPRSRSRPTTTTTTTTSGRSGSTSSGERKKDGRGLQL